MTYSSYADFFKAVPQVRTICAEFQLRFDDSHSKWLGRWMCRVEKCVVGTSSLLEDEKQKRADQLIGELVKEILVSPYDESPFELISEKRPVLFKGVLFPFWMLSDILNMVGNPEGIHQVIEHDFMNAMIRWSSSVVPMPRNACQALVPACYIDPALMVAIQDPKAVSIKLSKYRRLMINAFRIMDLRERKEVIEERAERIVRAGQKNKVLLESDKERIERERALQDDAIAKEFELVAETHASALLAMKNHGELLLEEIRQAEERSIQLQQECLSKKAQIDALLRSQ